MSDRPAKPVLLTGASGALGRVLTKSLSAEGWTLRLTDIAPFPEAVPAGASFTKADLNDGVTMLRLAEGCGAIVHLGGVSVERPFEEVLGPNIRGLYHIYEAARREKARVIFASSNHSIGFHERTETIGADTQFLPDGFYGLSKAYGELMGRLYWYKHGVESVFVRIGSAFPEPTNARMLATWLSYPDLSRLVIRCVLADEGWLQRDLGCFRQSAHDVVEGRCARYGRMAAERQRRSVCRSARGKSQRRSGGGALHGRSVLFARLFAWCARAAEAV